MELSNLVNTFVLMPDAFIIARDFTIHWDIERDTEMRHLNDLILSVNLKDETPFRYIPAGV